MGKDITLVVMAAGMGSRFGGLKQLEPIGKNGEVILDFSVYDAVKAGFNKVVFVIKHAIEDDFKRIVGSRIEKKVKVEYVFQETDALPEGFTCPADRQKPWGTAHAILCCKNVVKEPFAVVNADDYYGRSAFKKIYDELSSASEDYCMVGFRLKNTLTENGTVSRGVCVTDNDALESVTEYTKIRSDCSFTEDDGKTWNALSPDTVVSMNLWGFRPDVFKYIKICSYSRFVLRLFIPSRIFGRDFCIVPPRLYAWCLSRRCRQGRLLFLPLSAPCHRLLPKDPICRMRAAVCWPLPWS